jgi:hypothetical protein
MREQRAKLSRGHDLAKAIDYILKRWAAFTIDPLRGSILDDGRVCLSTMPPNARCAASLWAESLGCSVDLIAVVSELLPCTASSSRQR